MQYLSAQTLFKGFESHFSNIGRIFLLTELCLHLRFYTCSPEVYRGLAQMYANDKRFRAFYENIKPGLAEFISKAMLAFVDTVQ